MWIINPKVLEEPIDKKPAILVKIRDFFDVKIINPLISLSSLKKYSIWGLPNYLKGKIETRSKKNQVLI